MRILKNKIKNIVKKCFLITNPYGLSASLGHYYSPIPDKSDVDFGRMMARNDESQLLGIDIQNSGQDMLFERLIKHYGKFPFTDIKSNDFLYYTKNEMYGASSGMLLFSMILEFRPKRIIEIGSGYSSALMLDTDRLFFGQSIKLTFIEPFPDRLFSLIRTHDKKNVEIIQDKIQNVDVSMFAELDAGDILFIDGSHISKIGSDVNRIFFEILPILKKGVLVHIHDIFFPFEYPSTFTDQGIFWNELYILRSFLQFNNAYKIEFFDSYYFRKNNHLINTYDKYFIDQGGCFWMSRK